MYASIFTDTEWKAPIKQVYQSSGCTTCGLGRYYKKENFRQFQFTIPSDVPESERKEEAPTEVPVYQPDTATLLKVISELRRLPVAQLIAVLEPILPKDISEKYKRMFPKSLQKLIDAFSDQQISQGILLLPVENIQAIISLQVPAPLQLSKKAVSKTPLQISIDPSFNNSTLFSQYADIPRKDPNFSYMDPTFAIGNTNSSYDPFNIIINLDYPTNGVAHRSITTVYTSDKKLIFFVGIEDSPDEPMLEVIQALIPVLNNLVKYHYNQLRILFHCTTGISRSATLALAYYGKIMNYDLTRAYSQLSARRSVLRPNPGFINALEEFLS